MQLAEAVDDTLLGIRAHSRGAAFVDIFAKNAEAFTGRLCVLKFHDLENFHDVIAHRLGHRVFVFAVACDYAQSGNTPGVLLFRVEHNVIVIAGQALSLRYDGEIIGNLAADFAPPVGTEAGKSESVRVEFLAAVAIEAIAAQESFIQVTVSVGVLGNQETARRTVCFAPRGFELRQESACSFQGEMVHEVMAELPGGIAQTLGKARGA